MRNVVFSNRRVFGVWLIILGLAGFSIVGTPFSFAEGNSGRYVPGLLQLMDPELFSADPVVDAFRRFESAFYSGLGQVLRLCGVPVVDVEDAFYSLFIVLRLASVALLWLLMRSLNQRTGAFVLLAAWAAHEKSAAVGGASMFAPSLTHATVAVLLGTAAVALLLRQKVSGFWVLLVCALFVHSLIALHLVIVAAPVIVLLERGRLSRPHIIGGGLFGLAFLAYWLWMTPPAFDTEEARLFLESKGRMAHIAPQAGAALSWVSMVGRVVLALLAYHVLFARQNCFTYLAGFIAVGSLLAPALGVAATTSGNLQLAQLQPMRIFEWVNLFVFVLLACAVPKAWEKDRALSLVLLSVITLNVLNSLWGLAWLFLAIAGLSARWVATRHLQLAHLYSPILLWSASGLLTVAAVAMLIVGSNKAESLSNPVPVLLLILVLLIFWLPAKRAVLPLSVVTAAAIVALMGRTVYVHAFKAARQDVEFQATCHWIATNTAKSARFITAVAGPNAGNFRARALRVTTNEAQSAVFWVAPRVGRDNAQAAQQVQAAWNGHAWDMDVLWRLADTWDATHILLEGGGEPSEADVLHQQGNYRVLRVPR